MLNHESLRDHVGVRNALGAGRYFLQSISIGFLVPCFHGCVGWVTTTRSRNRFVVLGRFLWLGVLLPTGISYSDMICIPSMCRVSTTHMSDCQVTVLDSWHHCFVWGFCSESNGSAIQNEGQLFSVPNQLPSCQVWRKWSNSLGSFVTSEDDSFGKG